MRRRLLQFRFEHYRNVSTPKVPADVQLAGRPLDLYRALALPFEQDQGMRNFLSHSIAKQADFEAPLLSPASRAAIRVLHNAIHISPDSAGFKVSNLSGLVNLVLVDRGESAGLNERKLGDILTSLSFTNRTRKNSGYFLWLTLSDRERIHATARQYGVADSVEGCKICNPAGTSAPESATREIPAKDDMESKNSTSERREHRERQSRRSSSAGRRRRTLWP